MKGLTRAIALPYGRVLESVLRLRRRTGLARVRPVVVVLAFHRVLPREAHWLRPSLVVSTASFDAVLNEVRRRFAVVHLNDLASFLRDGARLERDAVLLTFDDGYRDLYEHARPILADHGLPGSFFVTTGFVDGTHLLWWDVFLALGIARSDEAPVAPTEPAKAAAPEPAGSRTREDLNRAVALFRRSPHSQKRLLLEDYASGPGRTGEWERAWQLLPPALSWDQVRQMAAEGHAIGAHGVSHVELVGRPRDEVWEEIRGSAARLTEMLGAAPIAFAYPGGLRPAGADELLRRAGFELAFTTRVGWVRRGDPPLRLCRVNLCEDVLVDERGSYRRELFYAALGGLFEKGLELRRRVAAWLGRVGWR